MSQVTDAPDEHASGSQDADETAVKTLTPQQSPNQQVRFKLDPTDVRRSPRVRSPPRLDDYFLY